MTTELAVLEGGFALEPSAVAKAREFREKVLCEWAEERKNANTRKAYVRGAEHWFNWCDDNGVPVLSARRQASARWSADLQEVYAPSTVNQHLSAMKSWYEYGLQEYEGFFGIQAPPWNKRHRVVVSNESQTLGLDLEQANELRGCAREYSARDEAACEILLGSGLRSAELEFADVGHMRTVRGHRILHVYRKRSKEQDLVLLPQAARAIDRHLAQRPGARKDEPLILCEDGERLTNRRLDVMVKRWCRVARLPEISPHGLRHTCATLALDATNGDLRKVQRMLGHADPKTTIRYDLARLAIDDSPTHKLALLLAS